MDIGKNIKAIRETLGLSIKDTANLLELSPIRYSNYERNKRQPDLETLLAIANFFKVSIDFLINGEKIKYDDKEITKKINDIKLYEKNKLLDLFNDLTEDNKTKVKTYIKDLLLSQK